MNNTQRKFLIEKIQTATNDKIKILEKTREKYPSFSNYMYKSVMNGELIMKKSNIILEAIKNKALKAKIGENWISEDRWIWFCEDSIKLPIESVIVIPEDYNLELKRVKEYNADVEMQISELRSYLNTIEMRIQLSSDKVLKSLINEIDDMGEIKLIDSKIKLLNIWN